MRSVCRETQIVPTAGLFYGVRVVLGALLLFVAKLSHLCTVLLSIGPASCIGPRLYLACAVISAYQSRLVVVHDRGLPTGIPGGVCSEQTLQKNFGRIDYFDGWFNFVDRDVAAVRGYFRLPAF